MNSKNIKHAFLGLVLLVCGTACQNGKNDDDKAPEGSFYTCSMDPQVVENKAGICPICRMDLILVQMNSLKQGQIRLSRQQIQLANIKADTLQQSGLAKEITLTGKVAIDQATASALSSRVDGRIERLYVKNPGDLVEKGTLLCEIYSKSLNAIQEEYLIALSQEGPAGSMATSAANRLLLYGMSPADVRQIRSTGRIIRNVSVYSDRTGFVAELLTSEGAYVSEGSPMFRFASASSLWVEAQVYLNYLPYIHLGTEAVFSIPAAGNTSFTGEVIFMDPQVYAPERIILTRFSLSGNGVTGMIKPGMMVGITIKTSVKSALSLPPDAIIQDSRGNRVWLSLGKGEFESRMVVTGIQNSRQVEILQGLKAGEVVVTRGAYLLESEYRFKTGNNPYPVQGENKDTTLTKTTDHGRSHH